MKYQIVTTKINKKNIYINHIREAYYLLNEYYPNLDREHGFLITLNNDHKVISISIIGIGSAKKVILSPRNIFIKACEDKANFIIVAHNHPHKRQKITPSQSDINHFRLLYYISKKIDIELLDSIVFNSNTYVSLKYNESKLVFT